MYTKSVRVKSFVRRHELAGVFRLDLIVGGSKAGLTRLRYKNGSSQIVVIDNAREIQLRRSEFGDNGIIYFAMGDGETTRSLHGSSCEETRDASNQTTNTNMYPGFGARLANAAIAADKLIASGEFQRFLRDLPDLVFRATKGDPSKLHFSSYGSNAGAANSGAAVKIVDVLVKSLSYFNREIQVNFDVLGPITFAGVAPRARINSASSLVSTLDYALNFSKPHELRTGKRVFLHEMIPLANDQETRNKFLMLDALTMNSTQMQDLLMQPQPNDEQDDSFGAIMSRNVDFKTPLDRHWDIASPVAASFLGEIIAAKEGMQPDISVVKDVHFDSIESREQRRESEETILDFIFIYSAKSLLNSIARHEKKTVYRMRFETTREDFVPEYIRYSMLESPNTLDEFLRRLELLQAYRQIAQNEQTGLDEEIVGLQSSIDDLEGRFIQTIDYARNKKRQVVPRGTLAFITELRRRHDVIQELKAQKDAADIGLAAIESEVEFLEAKLASIEAELKTWIPKDGKSQNTHLLTIKFIDDVFSRLMTLESLSNSEKLELFSSCAVQVTLSGLAKIVGSASNRIEPIVDRIVNGPYETLSPSHGAQRNQVGAFTIYALPPCEPENEALIAKNIKAINENSAVVFGDSLEFGACVQRIRFRRFHSVGSLFEGLTGHDLWIAFTDPLNPLNTNDNWQSLKRLGGRVEGERIVFDHPSIEKSE